MARGRLTRLPVSVPAGALATLSMDLAMLAAAQLGGTAAGPDRLGPSIIGRWALGLLRGEWRHADITREPARPGELPAGVLTHYATGIALTQAYLLLARQFGARSSLADATVFGVASAALPLFVLFPSLGYGPFALRSGDAARIDAIMLVGHVAFGIGIGCWVARLGEQHGSGPTIVAMRAPEPR